MIIGIIVGYLALLLLLGLGSSLFSRGTSKDYFVASHSIGPVLLLMSVFGTTMTAFALVGSTGKSFERGIGVYGLMASSSGLIHAACFFLVGIRLWVYGKKYGYVTQIQYFRDRFESNGIGYLLFPILVGMVLPYLLIGVIGACKTILPITAGSFPDTFIYEATPQWNGGVPPWLTGLVICSVVVTYVFAGGSRGAAWANTFQTIVFMIMGVVTFTFIANSLGGLTEAEKVLVTIDDKGQVVQPYRIDRESHSVVKNEPPKVIGRVVESEHSAKVAEVAGTKPHLGRKVVEVSYNKINPKTKEKVGEVKSEIGIPPLMFLSYMLIPLSVGMFPHLFQHWLTAKSAKTFRLTLVAHPLFIMIVWVPCVLIGAWGSGLMPPTMPAGAVLSTMVAQLIENPILTGMLTAGILAAIMSSLDSQFLCLGTIFTNDIVLHSTRKDKFTDKQIVLIARGFVVGFVALTYALAMLFYKSNVFDLAVWCFSGFSSLFPLVFCAVYWKRTTRAGAYACILAALVTWSVLLYISGGGEYTLWGGLMPVTLCIAASTTAIVVVSLMTQPPSEQTIKKFFPSKMTEV